MAFLRTESGGGPRQSRTPARSSIIHVIREASWSAPALWRFICVTTPGKDLKAAQTTAYAAVEKIHFGGALFRRDMAAKAFISAHTCR